MKCNKCNACGKDVDRSDVQNTFFVFMMKGYYLNDKYVPTKRLLLCDDCGFEAWNVIREKVYQNLNRRVIA
jgi:hypothetical protein